MTEIQSIDKENKIVHFDDNTQITVEDFENKFKEFFKCRIAGETLMPMDMERFMKRGSSKNLKQLVDGKKAEGVEEGSMDQFLSPRMKISLIGVFTVVIIIMVIIVVARNMGFF